MVHACVRAVGGCVGGCVGGWVGEDWPKEELAKRGIGQKRTWPKEELAKRGRSPVAPVVESPPSSAAVAPPAARPLAE